MISEKEKIIARMIQKDLPLTRCPFKDMENRTGLTEQEILQIITDLMHRGVIRKFGAVIRHQKVGYTSNALVVWAVPEEQREEAGNRLAAFPEITHCYERTPPFEGKYSIFTMVHCLSGREQDLIGKLAAASGIHDFKVLASEEEYKKTSMEYF